MLKSVANEHGKYLDRVEPLADQFTPQGLDAQRRAFGDSEAARAVDNAEQLAAGRVAEAESAYAAAYKAQVSQGDSLQHQTITQRLERQIGHADDTAKAETARKLIAEAHDTERRVLLSELPSFGVPPAVVEAAAVKAVPELAEAAAQVTKARQSQALISNDARRIRQAIGEGRRLSVAPVDPKSYDPDR